MALGMTEPRKRALCTSVPHKSELRSKALRRCRWQRYESPPGGAEPLELEHIGLEHARLEHARLERFLLQLGRLGRGGLEQGRLEPM